jgi:hypothetical protein
LNLKTHLLKHLEQVLALPIAARLKTRYEKFRKHGHFLDKPEDSGEMKPAREMQPVAP